MHWTVNLRSAPGGGRSQAAVAVGNEVYLFGGDASESPYINVHVFNTLSLRWKKLPLVATRRGEPPLDVPCVRKDHTAALVEYTVYLFGGHMSRSTVCCNVLYAFDVAAHTWFKPRVSGTVPDGRDNHSACVLEKVIFIYGGHTQLQLTGGTNDMYKLDTTTMVWELINTRDTAPSASRGHSVTIIGRKIFVFAGEAVGSYYEDIRVFDTETNLWKNAPPAQILRRYSHSAFTHNGELYIYGGPHSRHDLWKFNPETFSWKKVKPTGKGPSRMYGGCCCMVGDRVILFGDYKQPHDLYVLDLSPSLKTLCKLAVIQYGLDQSELTHDIRWELRVMNETRVLNRPEN